MSSAFDHRPRIVRPYEALKRCTRSLPSLQLDRRAPHTPVNRHGGTVVFPKQPSTKNVMKSDQAYGASDIGRRIMDPNEMDTIPSNDGSERTAGLRHTTAPTPSRSLLLRYYPTLVKEASLHSLCTSLDPTTVHHAEENYLRWRVRRRHFIVPSTLLAYVYRYCRGKTICNIS